MLSQRFLKFAYQDLAMQVPSVGTHIELIAGDGEDFSWMESLNDSERRGMNFDLPTLLIVKLRCFLKKLLRKKNVTFWKP